MKRQYQVPLITLALMVAAGPQLAWAMGTAGENKQYAEHKEHGGKEHGGAATHEGSHAEDSHAQMTIPSAEQLRQTIHDYVIAHDPYMMEDPVTGATRTLELVRVHERVGKTGTLFYSCTDMRDIDTGELLDLDFDVLAADGQLRVVDERIHKVGGEARYTYDANDNRIPLTTAPDSAYDDQDDAGPTQEHGGQEHGGSAF